MPFNLETTSATTKLAIVPWRDKEVVLGLAVRNVRVGIAASRKETAALILLMQHSDSGILVNQFTIKIMNIGEGWLRYHYEVTKW